MSAGLQILGMALLCAGTGFIAYGLAEWLVSR